MRGGRDEIDRERGEMIEETYQLNSNASSALKSLC